MGAKTSKSSLDAEELAYIKKHTNLDENTIKGWYEGFIKDCPKRKLTEAQFSGMYAKLLPGGNVQNYCHHVFRTFDTNNSGEIDFLEFLLAMNITSSGTVEEKLKWAFTLYDIDEDGTINGDELAKVIESIYELLDGDVRKNTSAAIEKVKSVFQQLDADGDCSITEEEFVSQCLKNEELKRLLNPTLFHGNTSK